MADAGRVGAGSRQSGGLAAPWAVSQAPAELPPAHGVAHDLNNLLGLILGYAETGLAGIEDPQAAGPCQRPGPLRHALEQIAHAAETGASLTGQLLRSAREPSRPRVPADLNGIVRTALELCQPLLGPSIRASMRLAPGLWPVLADPVAIEQVVINLLDNARDAMPCGGALLVATSNVELTEADAQTMPRARAGQWARLTVADSGVGMDAPTLEHIFEPFFTGKHAGTGLGLAIVHRTIVQHNGWVHVASERDLGAAFSVYLPARPGPAAER